VHLVFQVIQILSHHCEVVWEGCTIVIFISFFERMRVKLMRLLHHEGVRVHQVHERGVQITRVAHAVV